MTSKLIPFLSILNNQTRIFENLSPHLKCVICNSVLKNAKQTPCGCRMCERCITDYLSDGPKPCPSKQIECGDILLDMQDVHQDNKANKEICNLIITCPFQPCRYSNSVNDIVYHIDICEFREIECERCNKKFRIKYKIRHNETDCEMRTVICEYCNEQMSYKNLHAVHLNYENENMCSKFKSNCLNICEVKENVILEEHMNVSNLEKLECPFKSLKCDSGKMAKRDLISHLEQHTISHSKDMVDIILTFFKTFENVSSEDKYHIERTGSSTKDTQAIPPLMIQTTTEPITFRNGNYIWKLSNFETIQNDAERESRISIFSNPFYTNECGYKMRLKVYPTGDGVGKGSYLSFFFVIMKGEYDDLLSWPFTQKVTLSILDQESGVKHHKETFKPDTESICYQKPKEEYNAASGSSKFIPYSKIRDDSIYRRNDTIYLKISVENLDLPSSQMRL